MKKSGKTPKKAPAKALKRREFLSELLLKVGDGVLRRRVEFA